VSTTTSAPATSRGFDAYSHFRSFMDDLRLSPEDTGGKITFVGEDPIFPSLHRLGACISIPIMAGAAGIAEIWRQRSGRGQDLSIDLRKAIHGINPMYKFMPTVPCRSKSPRKSSACTRKVHPTPSFTNLRDAATP
jgi:hypothetical protein